MLEALQAYSTDFSFTIDVIDVDADDELVARYDELVPVLVGVRDRVEQQLCHYFLDAAKVQAFLSGR